MHEPSMDSFGKFSFSEGGKIRFQFIWGTRIFVFL